VSANAIRHVEFTTAVSVDSRPMAAEHSSPPLPHTSDRRPAMWPWLLMPIAALALYVILYSVRQGAPPSQAESDWNCCHWQAGRTDIGRIH